MSVIAMSAGTDNQINNMFQFRYCIDGTMILFPYVWYAVLNTMTFMISSKLATQ